MALPLVLAPIATCERTDRGSSSFYVTWLVVPWLGLFGTKECKTEECEKTQEYGRVKGGKLQYFKTQEQIL